MKDKERTMRRRQRRLERRRAALNAALRARRLPLLRGAASSTYVTALARGLGVDLGR